MGECDEQGEGGRADQKRRSKMVTTSPGLHQCLTPGAILHRPAFRADAGDGDIIADRAVVEPAGDRHCGQRRHARLVGELAAALRHAEHEDRPVAGHLHRDTRIAEQAFLLHLRLDGALDLTGGAAGGLHGADQRQGDGAGVGDAEVTRSVADR